MTPTTEILALPPVVLTLFLVIYGVLCIVIGFAFGAANTAMIAPLPVVPLPTPETESEADVVDRRLAEFQASVSDFSAGVEAGAIRMPKATTEQEDGTR